MALQLRRGTNAERATETFAVGELIYTTDTKQLYVGDGTTLGGILVSSSVASSPPNLTQNLNLNGFNISGTGTVSATNFVGDGSQLTNLPGGGGAGIVEGQEYAIDIMGDVKGADSMPLVDSSLGRVTADHYGDGSNLTGITLNQLSDVDTTGVTTNSVIKWDGASWSIGVDSGGGLQEGDAFDVKGSVFGDDSSLLVDAVNGQVTGPVSTTSLIVEPDSGENQVVFKALDNNVKVFNQRESNSDLSSFSGLLGEWQFATNGSDGFKSRAIIQGYHTSLIIAASDGSYAYPADTLNNVTATGVSLGGITPTERLDVRGNAIVEGWIQTGTLNNTDRDGITTPANGMLIYNSDAGQFQGYENGNWVTMRSGGGGGSGGSAFTNIGIAADDSTIRAINEGETISILGGTNVTTSSDAEGAITINATFTETNDLSSAVTWANIPDANVPQSAVTQHQAALSITESQISDLQSYALTSAFGTITLGNGVIDTNDSAAITITPAVVISSDLDVENDLVVSNTVTADKFISTGTETPEISATTNLTLTAGNAVVITSSPLRMASFTTTERNALAAQNGDIIYNTTDNKFQGYENGSWVNLI